MARRTKGIQFIYIFIGAFIGLLFVSPINQLVTDITTNNNSTGMAATIYGYIDEMYALCCLGLMVGSLYMFFRGR